MTLRNLHVHYVCDVIGHVILWWVCEIDQNKTVKTRPRDQSIEKNNETKAQHTHSQNSTFHKHNINTGETRRIWINLLSTAKHSEWTYSPHVASPTKVNKLRSQSLSSTNSSLLKPSTFDEPYSLAKLAFCWHTRLLYTFFQLGETPRNVPSTVGHDVSSEPPHSEHYF